MFAVIPQGDVATRTFPVHVRLENEDGSLLEGMEGYARLPTGAQTPCLAVPRDAILRQQGHAVVFAVENGAAAQHEVSVIGYMHGAVGVRSPTLKADMDVVTKGNERLRPGQPLDARSEIKPPAPQVAPAENAEVEKES